MTGDVQGLAERPSGVQLFGFEKQSDYPDYDGNPNRGVPVANGGSIPRDFAGFGAEVRGLSGGGCFTVSPDSTDCLREVNASGQEYTVMKRRERWLVRYLYTDATTGAEVLLKDASVIWATLTNGATCMEPYFYGCLMTGASQDYLSAWISGNAISCSLPTTATYKVRMYYQYSRYKGDDTIPAGAEEWVPAPLPATATTLNVPGKLITPPGETNWSLVPGKGAFRISLENHRLNPHVPLRYPNAGVTNVGGDTIDEIEAGETHILVEASECGEFYDGVSFTGKAEYLPESGGHLHTVSANTTPPTTYVPKVKGTVSDAPASFSGVTGVFGRWRSGPIKAGTFAGAYDISAHTDNVAVNGGPPAPRDAGPLRLTVGFTNFVNLWSIFPHPAIISVGANNASNCASGMCDNHRDLSQFGHRELIDFIAAVAARYRKDVDPAALLPVNDLSLPAGGAFEIPGDWALKYHISHRIGTDFDVNASATLNGITYSIDESELDKVVQKLGGLKMIEPSIHYRLPKGQIDAIVGSIK
jgi:hypothetical protein